MNINVFSFCFIFLEMIGECLSCPYMNTGMTRRKEVDRNDALQPGRWKCYAFIKPSIHYKLLLDINCNQSLLHSDLNSGKPSM